MTCRIGFLAYRLEFVDHPVPVRLVGPNGHQYERLSQALSYNLQSQPNRKTAVRYNNAFLWTLNEAHEAMPDVAEQYESGVDGARDAQDAFVVAMNVNSTEAAQKDGSMWLTPPRRLWGRMSDALTAMGQITSALADEIYGGQDPSKVDERFSRTKGEVKIKRGLGGKVSKDVDRRLRMGKDPSHAPRYDDPCFYERLVEGLEATRAPAPFHRIGGLGRYAGGRAFQILSLTIHDLLVRPKKAGVISAPNKGSKAERTMDFLPIDAEYQATLDWVGGDRKRLTGLSLERLRQMAANPREKDELRGMPLFTEDGVNFIKYDRLYRIFRRAAEWADLYIDDDEYRCTDKRRYVTFHYLRHEYVHRRLDEVDAMPAADRPAGSKAIISYMRWSEGEAMLAWYSAHHLVKVGMRAAITHNAKVTMALASASAKPKGYGRLDTSEADAMLAELA